MTGRRIFFSAASPQDIVFVIFYERRDPFANGSTDEDLEINYFLVQIDHNAHLEKIEEQGKSQ